MTDIDTIRDSIGHHLAETDAATAAGDLAAAIKSARHAQAACHRLVEALLAAKRDA